MFFKRALFIKWRLILLILLFFLSLKSLEASSGNLKIKEFTYLDGPDGNPTSQSRFKVGTTFYFQFKVYGFKMDVDKCAHLVEDLILESTDGKELQKFDDFFGFNDKALVGGEPADYIYMTNQLSFPEDSPPGTYVAHIIVKDWNSGEIAEAKHNFTLFSTSYSDSSSNTTGSNTQVSSDNNPVSYTEKDIKIAFARNGDILVINGDGSGETRVTTTGGCFNPKFFPDGKKIAYIKDRVIYIKDLVNEVNYKFAEGTDEYFWITDNAIFYLYAEGYNKVYFKSKNLTNNQEVTIAIREGDTSCYMGIDAVSEKYKFILWSGGSGRGNSVVKLDFNGNECFLSKIGQYSWPCKNPSYSFEDYNDLTSQALIQVSEAYGEATGIYIFDLNKSNIICVSPNNSANKFIHGKWLFDGSSLIVINNEYNLEKISGFIEKQEQGNKIIYPDKYVILTTSDDVVSIAGVTKNNVFYIRKSGKIGEYKQNDSYYLWRIGIDGSSPERLTQISSIRSWNELPFNVWYPGK